jgi:hypothetical protein
MVCWSSSSERLVLSSRASWLLSFSTEARTTWSSATCPSIALSKTRRCQRIEVAEPQCWPPRSCEKPRSQRKLRKVLLVAAAQPLLEQQHGCGVHYRTRSRHRFDARRSTRTTRTRRVRPDRGG